jgi:hypothetical protein
MIVELMALEKDFTRICRRDCELKSKEWLYSKLSSVGRVEEFLKENYIYILDNGDKFCTHHWILYFSWSQVDW